MTDEELMALMVSVDPHTKRIPPGVRAIVAAAVAAERERCAACCDAAAMEYDVCAASALATEQGRELHRNAAEWARSMAAAIRLPAT